MLIVQVRRGVSPCTSRTDSKRPRSCRPPPGFPPASEHAGQYARRGDGARKSLGRHILHRRQTLLPTLCPTYHIATTYNAAVATMSSSPAAENESVAVTVHNPAAQLHNNARPRAWASPDSYLKLNRDKLEHVNRCCCCHVRQVPPSAPDRASRHARSARQIERLEGSQTGQVVDFHL